MTGKDIRKTRRSMLLTQEKFGKLLGVSKNTVCMWEKDLFEPNFDNQRKLLELCKKEKIDIKG